MAVADNIKLGVLHDHYKESFAYIREREKQRDRFFLLVVALIGVLFLEVQYSNIFSDILGNIKLEFIELNANMMPLPVFLSVTWTCLCIVVLKYCQTSIIIERQYCYLHSLEKKISSFLGDDDIYCREGKAYLDKYPLFSNLVWVFYTLFFPITVILSVRLAIGLEANKIEIPLYHLIYDSLLTLGIMISFAAHRFFPLAKDLLFRTKDKMSTACNQG